MIPCPPISMAMLQKPSTTNKFVGYLLQDCNMIIGSDVFFNKPRVVLLVSRELSVKLYFLGYYYFLLQFSYG